MLIKLEIKKDKCGQKKNIHQKKNSNIKAIDLKLSRTIIIKIESKSHVLKEDQQLLYVDYRKNYTVFTNL